MLPLFSRFDKLLTGRRCTSEIGQKLLKELKYNSEHFKVVADTEVTKKTKVGVVYSLPYGMGLNTVVSRLKVFSRKNSNKQQVK